MRARFVLLATALLTSLAFALSTASALPTKESGRGRSSDESSAGPAPLAAIDLGTSEGVKLVKSQWRYSDTKIIEVDFKGSGPDKQPPGAPIKTYDYAPHAGGADFDDSKWETIEPTTLDKRRSTGRICFN